MATEIFYLPTSHVLEFCWRRRVLDLLLFFARKKGKRHQPQFEGHQKEGGYSMGLRMRQIVLIARELAPVVDEIRDVFGLEVAYRDPAVATFGLENAVFPVGNQFL